MTALVCETQVLPSGRVMHVVGFGQDASVDRWHVQIAIDDDHTVFSNSSDRALAVDVALTFERLHDACTTTQLDPPSNFAPASSLAEVRS